MAERHLDEGLEELRIAQTALASSVGLRYMVVAAEAELGRIDDARRDLAELRRTNPADTVAVLRTRSTSKHPGYVAGMQWMYDGLALAGMPDD